jgi:hypothetical protein
MSGGVFFFKKKFLPQNLVLENVLLEPWILALKHWSSAIKNVLLGLTKVVSTQQWPLGKAVRGNSDTRREKRRPISLAQVFEEKRNIVPTYGASC